jgi:hypothetical protein
MILGRAATLALTDIPNIVPHAGYHLADSRRSAQHLGRAAQSRSLLRGEKEPCHHVASFASASPMNS